MRHATAYANVYVPTQHQLMAHRLDCFLGAPCSLRKCAGSRHPKHHARA